jgi:hypothetical protein
VLAPNLTAALHIYINGTLQASGATVSAWAGGAATGPGVITFAAAPSVGATITADFSYYFPVRMTADSVDFTLFLSQYYKAKKFSFISVKN